MKMSSVTYLPALLLTLFNLIPGGQHNIQQSALVKVRPEISSVEKLAAAASIPSVQTKTPFTSEEGRFSITLPTGFSAFQHKVQAQPTAIGNIDVNIYNAASQSGACIVAYSDYPPATFEGRSTQKILEDGRDGALKSVNGILDKQNTITVQGHPGLSMYGTIDTPRGQIFFRFDYVLVQTRMYQIGYLAPSKAELNSAATQGYFKSFHLED